MRGTSLVGFLLYAALSCTSPQKKQSAESAVTADSASAEVERGTLVYVHEGDTTVIEEYTRTARTLDGIVRPHVQGAKFGWARYRVELGPSGTAQRAVLEVGRRSDESRPVRTWTVTVGAGEVVDSSSDGTTRRAAAAASVVPFFPPSMAMFHEAVRQAHRASDARGRVQVLVYAMGSSGEIHPVTIAWPAPDTAAVSYGPERPILYAVDTHGRLLGSRGQDGRHLVVRRR